MEALWLYKNHQPAAGETREAFSERIRKVQDYRPPEALETLLNQLKRLAGQWLSRTEACYFQTPRGRGTNPDELKELIINTYSHHTDWQEDSEYHKRIRCICSSRGHLYSNLSAYSSEGQYN